MDDDLQLDECNRLFKLLDDDVERLECNMSVKEYFTWGWISAMSHMKGKEDDQRTDI